MKFLKLPAAFLLAAGFALALSGCPGGGDTSSDSAYEPPATPSALQPVTSATATSTSPPAFVYQTSNLATAASQVNVDVLAPIVVTFSNPVSQGTITATSGQTADNIVLFENQNPAVVAAISAVATGNQVTISPLVALQPSTVYTLNILPGAGGVKDIYGQNLSGSVDVSFTTSSLGTNNPMVTIVTITENAGNQVNNFELNYGTVSGTGGVENASPPPTFNYPNSLNLISTYTYELTADTPFTFTVSNSAFTSGTNYYFAVKACNSDGCSTYSPELSAVMK